MRGQETNEANNFMKGGSFTISGARRCGIWSLLEFLILVFDRYNVVSISDVAEATHKVENRKLQVKMKLTPKPAPMLQRENRKSLKTA